MEQQQTKITNKKLKNNVSLKRIENHNYLKKYLTAS